MSPSGKRKLDESSDHFKDKIGAYPITSNPRGYCIIINNVQFDSASRRGSTKDAQELAFLFQYTLGFFVEVYNNLTSEKILVLLRNAQGADHSTLSCFVLAILSHGRAYDKIYGTDDKPVLVEDITSSFTGEKCRTLKGKPKIFLLGVCRGPHDDPGVTIEGTVSRKRVDEEYKVVSGSYTTPIEAADMMFITYSTHCQQEGQSLFVETFAHSMRKRAHKIDIMQIVIETNRIICESMSHQEGKIRCMLTTVSTLCYRLYLPPISPIPSSD